MKRKIISIDEARCNGCGLCVSACHEGAIQLVNGKAKLISDSYCDGLGDCLPACPVNAIRIIEREAADYDEAAVAARKTVSPPPLPCGCPGQMAKTIVPKAPVAATPISGDAPASQLTNWPVQIKLVNPRAPYLQNAALLIAADCTAFAYPDIHRMFMRNKVTLIGCPKLDEGDYAEKLAAIFQANDIKSVKVLRMEVPCCSFLLPIVTEAAYRSGKDIPVEEVVITRRGTVAQ